MEDLQKIKDYLKIRKEFFEEQEINFKKLKDKHSNEKKLYSALDVDIDSYQKCRQLIDDVLNQIKDIERMI